MLLAIRLATLELKLATFVQAFERRYRPDQPRAPRGTSEGGRWVVDVGATHSLPAQYAHVAAAVAGFRKHGIDQIINRAISPQALLDAVKNPLRVRPRPNETTQYVGADATIVLNADGEVVTVWPQ
jgi:hypothetical protein